MGHTHMHCRQKLCSSRSCRVSSGACGAPMNQLLEQLLCYDVYGFCCRRRGLPHDCGYDRNRLHCRLQVALQQHRRRRRLLRCSRASLRCGPAARSAPAPPAAELAGAASWQEVGAGAAAGGPEALEAAAAAAAAAAGGGGSSWRRLLPLAEAAQSLLLRGCAGWIVLLPAASSSAPPLHPYVRSPASAAEPCCAPSYPSASSSSSRSSSGAGSVVQTCCRRFHQHLPATAPQTVASGSCCLCIHQQSAATAKQGLQNRCLGSTFIPTSAFDDPRRQMTAGGHPAWNTIAMVNTSSGGSICYRHRHVLWAH